MYVAHLSLTDFRSYAQVELALEPGITALVGPNGQGKTNLVEAIGYVATLGSHRVADGRGARPAGRDRAVVRARVVRELEPGSRGRRSSRSRSRRARRNRARVNGGSPDAGARRPRHRCAPCCSRRRTSSLVKGDPDGRRRFLDDLLVQLDAADRGRRSRTTTGCCGSAPRCSSRRAPRCAAADGCGPAHARRVGRQARADRGADHRRAPARWSGRSRRTSRRRTRRSARVRATRSITYKASLDAALGDRAARRRRRRRRAASRRSCSRRWAGCAARRSSAA